MFVTTKLTVSLILFTCAVRATSCKVRSSDGMWKALGRVADRRLVKWLTGKGVGASRRSLHQVEPSCVRR